MGLRQKIMDLLGDKEIEIKPEQAVEVFSDEKKGEIDKTREKEDVLREKTGEVLDDLAEELGEMEDFDDSSIQAVKDVAANFSAERRRMAERLQPAEEFPEHAEDFLDFREEFNDVSEKEAEVLKRVKGKSGDLPDALKQLEDHGEKLEEFVEDGRDILETRSELEGRVDELEDLRERRKEKENELEEIDIERLRGKKEDLKDELEDLKNSDEWMEKTRIEDRIEELREEKDRRLSDLSGTASGIERSLRKVIYFVDEDGGEFEGEIDDLRHLSDQEFSKVRYPRDSLQEALEIIEEQDLVSDRQKERFSDSIEKLSDLEDIREEVNGLEEEIMGLEDQLDAMDVQDERKRLQDDIDRISSRIDSQKDRKQEIEQRLDEMKGEEKDIVEEISELLEEHLGVEVTMEV